MERSGLRRAQESVPPLWERTQHFRAYSSWLVPGPFQTRAYIEALLRSIRDRRALPDDLEEAVQVRVDKQHVLYEGRRRFAVLLEESVLRHRIGGADTMAGQLGHLLSLEAPCPRSCARSPDTIPCGRHRRVALTSAPFPYNVFASA